MSPEPAEQTVVESKPSSSKRKLLTLGIVGAIMLLERVGIFVVVRMTRETPPSEASELAQNPAELLDQMDAELALIECDAINRKSGQSIVVHISISVRVAAGDQEHAARLIEKRQDTFKDRVQMILRSAEPQHLNEPNLDTLKRQVKFEVDKILEDDKLILEVLIPQILQSRSHL